MTNRDNNGNRTHEPPAKNGDAKARWFQVVFAAAALALGFVGGAFTFGTERGAVLARLTTLERTVAIHTDPKTTPYHPGVPAIVADLTKQQTDALSRLTERIATLEAEVRSLREDVRGIRREDVRR